MKCDRVDELAAAYALGAVDAHEEREISEHLTTCERQHTDARELIGAASLLGGSVEPLAPSEGLRSRLMDTIAETPQEHRATPRVPAARVAARPPWWRTSPLLSGVAAVLVAAAVGVGAWNVTLQRDLAERDEVVRSIAGAEAAHRVTGAAGEGWLVETEDGAVFLATGLEELPPNRLYELWLIGPDSEPVAVGTVDAVDDVTIVSLERPLEDAATFAVTVEAERVEAPTSEPVLVGSIGS